jgi:phosphoglycolate phosphatase
MRPATIVSLLRCVYTDLDGTLLGHGGSLFRDGEGAFTLLPARALEACFRAGVEVVVKSGRREAQVMEDARLLGQTSYIYEVGAGLVIDGERTLLTGDWQPRDGESIHALIEESGAPALLLERFAGRLEYHSPWHEPREISHLFRGTIDAGEANEALAEAGHESLRLVDNGAIAPRPQFDRRPHAFHLIPAATSKANAVAAHMRARGYAPEECIAVGDSDEDADVGRVVGRFIRVTEPAVGFYEAVIETLARH